MAAQCSDLRGLFCCQISFVLCLMWENNFDLDILRMFRIASLKHTLSASVTVHWAPFVRYLVGKKPEVTFMHSYDQAGHNTKQVQVLTDTRKTQLHLSPTYFSLQCIDYWCDLPMPNRCQGQSRTPESPSVTFYRLKTRYSVCGRNYSTVSHALCFHDATRLEARV
jgi:hypothetical protein